MNTECVNCGRTIRTMIWRGTEFCCGICQKEYTGEITLEEAEKERMRGLVRTGDAPDTGLTLPEF